MDGGESFSQIRTERVETLRQRFLLRDKHVIMIGLCLKIAGSSKSLFQAASNAISLDRAANLARCGKPDPGI